MKKIIGNIFEEDDYSVFRRLQDNRDVLSGRLNKLIASISERYIVNPIICNEKMEVIDGQGRFEARKQLGLPIHYIIVERATSDDCRRMNKYNTKWSSLDFCKSYAKKGIEPYQLVLKTCKDTGLPLGIVLKLSDTNVNGKYMNEYFEKGLLSYTAEDHQNIVKIVRLCNEIADSLQVVIRQSDCFRHAVKIISETSGYDHNRMLRNCKHERSSYSHMATLKDQLIEFERIYNKGSSKNRIYFSDYMRNRGSNVRSYDCDFSSKYSPYKDKDISTLKQRKEDN